jgi:hypothetical protein
MKHPHQQQQQQNKKRGAKGICASGVCTTRGVIPLAQYLHGHKTRPMSSAAARALPVLASRVGMTAPAPAPTGGAFVSEHRAADPAGPCDMCCRARGTDAEPPFHVLRVTGRGCMPVGHGVYCSAECAQTAVFRHPAYRHWDDTDRFVALQTMQRNPRAPIQYACALFHDSIYLAGRRCTTEVAQNKYKVHRASEQQQLLLLQTTTTTTTTEAAAAGSGGGAAPAKTPVDPRWALLSGFFNLAPEKIASLLNKERA